jgi:hypothetical protein
MTAYAASQFLPAPCLACNQPLGCQRTTTKWLVMVTTLFDPVAVSAQSLGALYKMRWFTMNGEKLVSKGS